ncbi:hypothetical protein AAEO56_18625 [Flavobacterium sp. DGU11]|uniref:Uncharacterized protein n=1 Tax=Flavobacterium arundinis TaxID=3139143 RepID=A0ABU9I239_9FLAO
MTDVEFYLKRPGVKITSFKDINSNYFKYFNLINVDDTVELQSDYYIEGVIIFKKDNQFICDFTYYDLIDQLASYFITAIHKLMKQEINEIAFSFPDQPIEIRLKRKRNNYYFQIEEGKWYEFPLAKFLDKSKLLFDKIDSFLNKNSYSHERNLIQEIFVSL